VAKDIWPPRRPAWRHTRRRVPGGTGACDRRRMPQEGRHVGPTARGHAPAGARQRGAHAMRHAPAGASSTSGPRGRATPCWPWASRGRCGTEGCALLHCCASSHRGTYDAHAHAPLPQRPGGDESERRGGGGERGRRGREGEREGGMGVGGESAVVNSCRGDFW